MARNIKRRNIPTVRQEEILNAAAELFADKGYHGVSVDSIAKKAEISKGNLYWHFKSKQEIFHQLFEYLAGPLFEPLMQVMEDDLPPHDKLRALSRACFDTAESNPEVIRFGWQIAAQPELKEMFTSEYTEWMKPFIDRVAPIFAAAGEKNPEDIAKFFGLTLDAFMGMAVMMPEMFDKEATLAILDERFIQYGRREND